MRRDPVPESDTRSLYPQRSTDGRRGVFMSILWIILIIVIVLALLGFLGRGAW
jgi:flagellar basal body-associated protein FliL